MLTLAQLKKFCSTDKSRPELAAPFSRGGDTYAMDGALCIRVPRMEAVPDDPWNSRPGVGADHLFSRLPIIKPSDLVALPGLPARPEYRERRQWYTPPSLIIGGGRFGLELLWRIAKLPQVRLAPNLTVAKDPLQFVFRGGDGLIMPMHPDAVFTSRSMIYGEELSESEKLFVALSRGQ